MDPGPDQKPARWWMVPGTVGPGAILIAILIGAVGIRYDERGESPGMMVWVAVISILPFWLSVPLMRRMGVFGPWSPPHQQPLTPEMLEILKRLQEAQQQVAERGSITAVVNTLAPPAITESSDGQRR